MRRNRNFVFARVTAAAVLVAAFLWWFRPPVNHQAQQQIAAAFAAEDDTTVLQLAGHLISQDQLDADSALLAARAARRRSQSEQALDFLELIPWNPDSATSRLARLEQADIHESSGRLATAARLLRAMITQTGDSSARRKLARLLAGVGMSFDAVHVLRGEAAEEVAEIADARLLLKNGVRRYTPSQLERFFELHPEDPLVCYGMVTQALLRRDATDAKRLLRTALPDSPALGRLRARHRLRSEGTTSAVLQTLREQWTAAGTAAVHPELLLVTAEAAHAAGQTQLGLGCLKACLDRFPWHPAPLHLAANLASESHMDLARNFRHLAAAIDTLERLLPDQSADRSGLTHQRTQIAEQLFHLGRLQEAQYWARRSLQSGAPQPAARRILMASAAPDFEHPARQLPVLQTGQLMKWLSAPQSDDRPTTPSSLMLTDVAQQSQLDFLYDNGRSLDRPGLLMHEWTGGGLAVIDIDHDSWPDAAFTQGIAAASATTSHHRLFRNRRGRRFQDASVALPALAGRFGQGIAAGDVNNDGFTDLYIASTTTNLLLLNLGDGTFARSDALPADASWTTSCGIADLNGDQQPDLYDVNYVQGETVFTQMCDHDGRPRICAPTDFEPAADRILLNSGDGSFAEATSFAEQQVAAHSGAGMGLLVGCFTDAFIPQVYIANDEYANQLWTYDPTADRWDDQASINGLAVDAEGRPRGSMGIAMNWGPDQQRQVFVTNYFSEANDLFREVTGGTYVAAAAETGLAAASFHQLGFGTQFADLNGDGRDELFVANGHLDDFTFLGHPYRMQAQLFQPAGRRFREINAGSYFDRPEIGRAAATIDWNRDGRTDLLVGHLYQPVALLENQSHDSSPQVALRLIGRSCARDPIGSTVSRPTSDGLQIRQLTAGDGYQCSNERLLRFAGPQHTRSADPAELTVQWSGGATSVYRLPVSRDAAPSMVIVEGRAAAWAIPR